MCRFFAYVGEQTLPFNIMYRSTHSLIAQSKSSKKRESPVNGDGFGLGWYPVHADPQPGTYVATTPAWSDRNLLNLCSKISTPCFFAHVRDASPSMPISLANCHPFQFGNFLWMHNGYIDQFDRIKRELINQLSDKAFLQIRGNTDSEYAFAVFLDQIKFNNDATLSEIESALIATINLICRALSLKGVETSAYMNFMVSSGSNLVSTRFTAHINHQPPSLFYTGASVGLNQQGELVLYQTETTQSIIIASEPITNDKNLWHKINRNYLVSVDQQRDIKTRPIVLQ